MADLGIYFFVFFLVVVVFFAGCAFLFGNALYSRYSAWTHVYTNNADIAVIKPAIKPSENIANNNKATANTTVYPKFLDNTCNSFSNIFPSFV